MLAVLSHSTLVLGSKIETIAEQYISPYHVLYHPLSDFKLRHQGWSQSIWSIVVSATLYDSSEHIIFHSLGVYCMCTLD